MILQRISVIEKYFLNFKSKYTWLKCVIFIRKIEKSSNGEDLVARWLCLQNPSF